MEIVTNVNDDGAVESLTIWAPDFESTVVIALAELAAVCATNTTFRARVGSIPTASATQYRTELLAKWA